MPSSSSSTAGGRYPAGALAFPHRGLLGIAQLQTHEILFLLDDDSFMYPDCAERIMAVYDADADGLVGGIQTGVTALPPPAATHGGAQKKRGSRVVGAGSEKDRGRVGRWCEG